MSFRVFLNYGNKKDAFRYFVTQEALTSPTTTKHENASILIDTYHAERPLRLKLLVSLCGLHYLIFRSSNYQISVFYHQNPFIWCSDFNLHRKRDFSSNILCVPHDKTLRSGTCRYRFIIHGKIIQVNYRCSMRSQRYFFCTERGCRI